MSQASLALALAASLGVAGCGGGVGPTAPTEAPSEAPRLRIAYNVLENRETDDYEVYVMEQDGSGSRNLTTHPGVEWVYSALGSRLYIVSDRDDEKRKYHLYEVEADGSGLRQITPFRVRDSWVTTRRKGEEIVVSSSKDGAPDLYLIDRNGHERQRLTNDQARDRDPVFSPDGTRLVWVSDRSGLDELWLMELDTGESRRLTYYPEDDPSAKEHVYHAGPPFWEAQRDVISFCSHRAGSDSIFTIRPDGTGLERLTPDGSSECWHSWSPDGRYLAYDFKDAEGNYDIYVRDTQTGESKRLTTDPRLEQAPVFLQGATPVSRRNPGPRESTPTGGELAAYGVVGSPWF